MTDDPLFYVELIVAAVLTMTLWATRGLLVAHTRPQVECYLRSRPDKPNVFELAVANFGKGAAKNLEIELIGVDEIDFSAHSVQLSWRRKGPFTLLGPGESIESLFGFGSSLVGEDREPLKPFKVRSSYRWKPFWYWRFDPVVEYHDMDVRPFQGIIPKWPKDEMVELLKKELPKLTKAVEARPRPRVPDKTGTADVATLRQLDLVMPKLFAEMRADVNDSPLKREFVVLHKNSIYLSGGKSILAYYYEDHEDLPDKMVVLANSGAVTDITYNSVDRYLMSEALVKYLISEVEADAA